MRVLIQKVNDHIQDVAQSLDIEVYAVDMADNWFVCTMMQGEKNVGSLRIEIGASTEHIRKFSLKVKPFGEGTSKDKEFFFMYTYPNEEIKKAFDFIQSTMAEMVGKNVGDIPERGKEKA
jgi:hypothetical protein